jgi:hypothetical protein
MWLRRSRHRDVKKLLASLLLLPFLIGANVRPGAPPPIAPPVADEAPFSCATCVLPHDQPTCHAAESFSVAAAGPPSAQPPLPTHATAVTFVAPVQVAGPGAGSWRTPTRSAHEHSDPPARAPCRASRTRFLQVQHDRLEFTLTLARSRTNEPSSFSNPPPVSTT